MSRPKLVNLLDDFAMGGVTRGLTIFDSDAICAVVEPRVEAIAPGAMFAPHFDAEIIVLHVPPGWQRLMYVSSLRLRNPQAKIIWIEHSYTPAWEALKVGSRARFRATLRLAFRLADQVVCVSHAQARWLAEAAVLPLDAIEVIYPYAANPGLEELPLPSFSAARPLRVGAYGRLSEQKGFDLLINAHRCGLMPGTELLIGGTGEDEAMLMAMAGQSKAIRFYGLVTDVGAFLGETDVVALPSRWEAYGQVANEARIGGRPIVVAPCDGLPEQVGDAGMVIDFTSDAAILEGFTALRSANLPAMAAAARASTVDCGIIRQRQWARLLDRLLTEGKVADGALAA